MDCSWGMVTIEIEDEASAGEVDERMMLRRVDELLTASEMLVAVSTELVVGDWLIEAPIVPNGFL